VGNNVILTSGTAQVRVPQCKKDVKLLESIQRRAIKTVNGLEDKMYKK